MEKQKKQLIKIIIALLFILISFPAVLINNVVGFIMIIILCGITLADNTGGM